MADCYHISYEESVEGTCELTGFKCDADPDWCPYMEFESKEVESNDHQIKQADK
jgi:hypothetical protein